jgi:hypothetical protein
LTRPLRLWHIAAALCLISAAAAAAAAATDSVAPATLQRVEARSADLFAVGLVRADRMIIHLSRSIDNAPVRDAVVTVMLRGTPHATIAEADGSYSLRTPDLTLPGAVAVEFQVVQAGGRQTLKGMLQIEPGAAHPEDKNTARQLWWWVLNFAVCIGFLWLISRRRKSSTT